MVGILLSFWDDLLSVAMLVLEFLGVYVIVFGGVVLHKSCSRHLLSQRPRSRSMHKANAYGFARDALPAGWKLPGGRGGGKKQHEEDVDGEAQIDRMMVFDVSIY